MWAKMTRCVAYKDKECTKKYSLPKTLLQTSIMTYLDGLIIELKIVSTDS